MPGNEVGDRVHNFFAQDNLSQGQHHSQVVEGNWPVLNNNLWVGSQRQIGVPGSNLKNYNLQQSDIERGHSSHHLQVPHGLNLTTQPNLRPEFAKNQSHGQQLNLNGYVYGQQVFQTRQDEANFLGVDTESDQHNLVSRGLPIYESQQGNGPEHHTKASARSETSESPVSFDFFGGQQQMSAQQPGMLQSLPQQQSGFSDMQQLQQEVMFRKMQELQRQQQLRQLDARQQNSINHVPSFARQASGNHSPALINATPISDASGFPWATELTAGNMNWLPRAPPAMQASSNGLVFSPEQGQASRLMGLVPQQVDQSLYGVPISSSRSSLNQYPHIATDKPSMQQMPTISNSLPGNQYAVFPDHVSMQDGTLISRQGFQGRHLFGHTSNQGVNSGINMENLQQQVNPLQRNTAVQEFHGGQELAGPSETLQEKTSMQAVSSQNAVALDPTEEKILFGSDDNIWDAFGSSTNMSGGASNLLDGRGFLNGLPSLQSGSWSALMQSAVAETSSSDMGLQEEWSGPSFLNTELPTGNHQQSTYNDSGKQQTISADDNMQIASELNSGSVPLSHDSNMNNNYHSVLGFQQFGQKFPSEQVDRMQTNSQRSMQQSSGGSKWLNRGPLQKPHAEGSQNSGNASHPLDTEMNARNVSVPWTPRHSGSSQPSNKPNSWSIIEPVPPSVDAALNIHENEKHSQSNDRKRAMHEEIGHGGIWKVNSIPNSTVELNTTKSTMGIPQVNREGSGLNNADAIPNSSTTRACEETSQFLPNSRHLNYWKHVDSVVKSKESEGSERLHHHLNKAPQVLETSLNSSDKDEVKMPEMENCNKKENSNDRYRSNLQPHTSSGGLKDNVLSDASDSRTLPGGKQKSSNQAGRKASGPRRFQYHPMGNLDEDVEPSYGTRQTMSQQNSQGLKSHDQGYFGQSKFFGQVPKNSTETGKGHLPNLQGDAKGFDESPSRGSLPVYTSNMSASLERSVGMHAPNRTSQSSQKMLELLHKVDQSRERGTMMHLSSSECNRSSEMPEAENSDGSVGHFQRSQSSASQGFGLRLAPPSQQLPVPSRALPSQSSARTVNSFSSTQATSEIRDKGHSQLAATASVQFLPPSRETSQGEFKNNRIGIQGQTGTDMSIYRTPGNFTSAFNSGFPYSRSQLPSQLTSGMSGQLSTNQSMNTSFDRHASLSKQMDDTCRAFTGQSADAAGSIPFDNLASSGDTSQPTGTSYPHERVSAPQILAGESVPVSRPFTMSSISQQGSLSKVLPNVSAQHHLLGAQARKVPSSFSQFHQSNIVESTSYAPQNLEDKDAKKEVNVPSEFGARSVNSQGFVCGEEQLTKESPSQQVSSGSFELAQKANESQEKEPITKHLSDASSVNSTLTQRDIEAFGRSLKPNNFFHQNYSLLNQVRAAKNTETDPSNRGLKRLKGSDSGPVGQQVAPKAGHSSECNTMVEDALVRRTAVPSGDSKMLSFSGPLDNLQRNASSHVGNEPSQDMVAFGWSDSQNSRGNITASVKVERSQISPLMAPSWFDQYGIFKNGQMLPMYDSRNAAADTSHVGNIGQSSTPTPVPIEQFSSVRFLPPDLSGHHLVLARPKKRKSTMSELHPWHKEVSSGSQSLQTISVAEVDWARAANRLIEKVEDEAEMIEDGLPMLRPKRRLIMTTQLMQHLLRAAPAAILSADASSNHESMVYFVARLALGDACSLVSCTGSNSRVPQDGAIFLSDKCKTSERIDDQHPSKVVEEFMGRARKLENDFLRLDKRASVLDLKLECQDLEKFSVINRFAKFHGRGQAEGSETSSSSDAAGNTQKTFPQRYVTAVPMPRNLPDRVQCLSL